MAKSKETASLEEGKKKQVSQSYWSLVAYKFKKNKLGIAGAVILIIMYATMVLFPEFIGPYLLESRSIYSEAKPQKIHFIDSTGKFHLRPFVYGMDKKIDEKLRIRTWVENPDRAYPIYFLVHHEPYKLLGLIPTDLHLFGVDYSDPQATVYLAGTDANGRDYFSRIFYGGRLSLMIGLIGQLMTIILGAGLGVISGYYGGAVDILVQRSTEFLAAFPNIPLFMALSAAIPSFWSPIAVYFMLTVILAVLGWGGLARQVRGMILSLREREYALAAKAFGANDSRIMFRHLLPGTVSHVIVIASLAIPSMILAETALSWLGLGLRPPLTSWGVLLQEGGRVSAIRYTPWLLWVVFPVLIAVMAYNMLGDGLRDAMDPYGAR
jgi:peptide/nickel transport system permease protein